MEAMTSRLIVGLVLALAGCSASATDVGPESTPEGNPPVEIQEEGETELTDNFANFSGPSTWTSSRQADSWVSQTESGEYTINYVPDGFEDVDGGVAFRATENENTFEVTPYKSCTVRMDAVFVDSEKRVIEEVYEYTDVPFGYVGVLNFGRGPNGATGLEIMEVNCYFSTDTSYLEELAELDGSTIEVEVDVTERPSSGTDVGPWAPEDYWEATENIAFRWVEASGDPCDSPCLFWRAEVLTKTGCPSGVSATAGFSLPGGGSEEVTTTLASLVPGEPGGLAFILYGYGNSPEIDIDVELLELSCS